MAPAGKVALVTGASAGIGRAAAAALLQAGYRVALVGRRRELLDSAAAAAPDQALVLPADLTDPTAVGDVFRQVEERWGRLDVLFNNAGMGTPPASIEDVALEDWRNAVDLNLTATFLCTQEAFRLMKRQDPRGGRIINNGSISAHSPRLHSTPYTATKHAITGLTRSTSLDGRAHDIACGQIDIGNAVTEMTERMAAGALQPDGSLAPEARMDVQVVADALLYMAGLPLDANVQFMTVMATKMPYIGRG